MNSKTSANYKRVAEKVQVGLEQKDFMEVGSSMPT